MRRAPVWHGNPSIWVVYQPAASAPCRTSFCRPQP